MYNGPPPVAQPRPQQGIAPPIYERTRTPIDEIKEAVKTCDEAISSLRDTIRTSPNDIPGDLILFTMAFDYLDIKAYSFLLDQAYRHPEKTVDITTNGIKKVWKIPEIVELTEKWIDRIDLGDLDELANNYIQENNLDMEDIYVQIKDAYIADMGQKLYKIYKYALVRVGLYEEIGVR